MIRLAIIGDMHMQFDEDDVRFFNGSDYGAILLVGDLSSKNPDSMFKLLPLLNQLTKPTYFIPGNHDTTGVRQLLGELMQNEFLINFGADSQDTRMQKLKAELTAPILCGYSSHSLAPGLGLVAARPFSMGSTNGTVNFKPFLQKEYGVSTLDESRDKIKSLIDAVNPPYLVLAHHGPFGLGAKPTDMFGADFLPQETDFGDADLTGAIAYAVSIQKPPLAVIAGHMHYPTKHGKKPKQWYLRRDGILYINAARWPRIFRHEGRELHHHVRLILHEDSTTEVEAVYVSQAQAFTTTDDRAILP
ncbi:MAG: metallophosphoesterase [Turneriella sp.]